MRLLLALAIISPVMAADPPSGIDTASMNRAVNPGGLLSVCVWELDRRESLPADGGRWGRFTELSNRNEKVPLDILQGAEVTRAG